MKHIDYKSVIKRIITVRLLENNEKESKVVLPSAISQLIMRGIHRNLFSNCVSKHIK